MYMRLSFLYQSADKMTKRPSQVLRKSLSTNTQFPANGAVTYLI